MSDAENDDEINRREVAYRLFAAEFDDADYSYAESDEERAPNYVVTPTGARVNRVFVVGVLTEVEQVNEDVLRARIVDPTGAFVVYAGQYQPEALAALEAAETPSFVAVTGKARTFEPDDSDVVYTSIRPESVSEVDAETRDRWVVTAAEQTVERVATMAAAHGRVERGDALRNVLEAAGVQNGLAAGIPLALDHYGTTPAYLAAVRDLALDAARVVAGDVESAGELGLAPGGGGDHPMPFAAKLDAGEVASEAADDVPEGERESDDEPTTDAEPGTESASAVETTTGTSAEEVDAGDESTDGDAGPTPGPAAETPSPSDVAEDAAPDSETDDEEDDAENDEEEGAPAAEADATSGGDGDGEMYELSEEEREEVEENYDVGFSSGDEIPDAGDADMDAETPVDEATEDEPAGDESFEDDTTEDDDLGDFDDGGDDQDEDTEDADSEDDADDLDDFTESEYDESESDAEDADAGSMDLDLEDYVVDLMSELDDGDGAPRDEVIGTAADERDADEGEIEDAIQDALMNGRCYEAGDDHLKAI